jgi:hypothetical protein
MRRKIATAAAAALLGAAGLVTTGGTAAYAGDIGDPVVTGCINHVTDITSSKIIDQHGDLLGYVQNYYSAYCGSNWGRVYTSGEFIGHLSIVACQTGDGGGCSLPDPYFRTDRAAYSDMVVGTKLVCATGTINVAAGGGVDSGSAQSCQ